MSICYLLQLFKKLSALCTGGYLQMCVTLVRLYLGAGKLSESPWPCTLGKVGLPAASWMPSGCSHLLSYTLGQEPAPYLANLPTHLSVIRCCHIARSLKQTKHFYFTENFKTNREINIADKVDILRVDKRPPSESRCILTSLSGCVLEEQVRSVWPGILSQSSLVY